MSFYLLGALISSPSGGNIYQAQINVPNYELLKIGRTDRRVETRLAEEKRDLENNEFRGYKVKFNKLKDIKIYSAMITDVDIENELRRMANNCQYLKKLPTRNEYYEVIEYTPTYVANYLNQRLLKFIKSKDPNANII